jgi:hypothetical protein
MALTNAEKQARWRERHAMKRYAVQRISKAILRRQWNDGTIAELASALRQVLTTSGIAALRRALKPETMKEGLARQKEALRRELALWRREHPGKTAEDYWSGARRMARPTTSPSGRRGSATIPAMSGQSISAT